MLTMPYLARTALGGLAVALVLVALPMRVTGSATPVAHRARPHLYHVDAGVKVFWYSFSVNKFVPDHLVIHAGDSVQWTTVVTNAPQTVTFGPLLVTPPLINRADAAAINPAVVRPQGGTRVTNADTTVYSSGALGGVPGLPTSYRFTFPVPGHFYYRSLFHPAGLAEVEVVPAGAPASGDQVDHGPSLFDALRSAAEVVEKSQAVGRNSGASGGSAEVEIGGGSKTLSVNTFTPAGLTVKVGSTIRWVCRDTSGDPHALVFGNLSHAEEEGSVPLYTGLAANGGLTINPDYATPSLPSGTVVLSDTLAQQDSLYTSGILYGSNVNYPSQVPSSYSLTFQNPAQYFYVDPFHPGMGGLINVVP